MKRPEAELPRRSYQELIYDTFLRMQLAREASDIDKFFDVARTFELLLRHNHAASQQLQKEKNELYRDMQTIKKDIASKASTLTQTITAEAYTNKQQEVLMYDFMISYEDAINELLLEYFPLRDKHSFETLEQVSYE